jgi:hypothetical protein
MSAAAEYLDVVTVPSWPRGVTEDHLAADADHTPVVIFDGGIADNCETCGLAVTSNGERHGWDESGGDSGLLPLPQSLVEKLLGQS